MRALLTRLRGDAGFTVAEYLSAAVILLVVTLGTTGGLTFASASTANSAKREQAMNLANQRLEQARNLPYDQIGTRYADGGYGNPPGEIVSPEIVGEFTVTTEVKWKRDTSTGRATYKKVYITVSWEKPRNGSVTVETAIMGKSTLVNTGDVVVNIYDSETNEPVQSVTVNLAPSSGSGRRLNTDADGEAFFGYVPSGPVTITANKPGWVISAETLAGAQVPYDDVAWFALPADKESTGHVKVVSSTTGAPIEGASVSVQHDLKTDTQVTGPDGVATFTGLGLSRSGPFPVTVTAAGWIAGAGELNVTNGGSVVNATVTLSPPAQIKFHVAAQDGSPLSGATVSVTRGGIPVETATTASSGDATFDLAESGTYDYGVSKSGYIAATGSFTATVGQEGTVNVTLAPVLPGTIKIIVQKWGSTTKYSGRQVGVWKYDAAAPGTIYTSNSVGEIIINNVTPYTYRARAQSQAYSTSEFTVNSGQTTVVTVWVKR